MGKLCTILILHRAHLHLAKADALLPGIDHHTVLGHKINTNRIQGLISKTVGPP